MDTTLATNIINSVVAVAALGAVLVAMYAIRESRKQAKDERLYNQKQATEDRQHQSRPILVPVGEITQASAMAGPGFYRNNGIVIWNYQGKIKLALQNMGGGVALNVHCVLYGPESQYNLNFVSWDNGPIGTNPAQTILVEHPNSRKFYLFPDDSLDGIHPIYDTSPTSPANPIEYRIACLTITYHDLFGIKHMSIFNYTLEHRWVLVATGKIPTIKDKTPFDLKELNDWKIQHGPKYSAPAPQLSQGN